MQNSAHGAPLRIQVPVHDAYWFRGSNWAQPNVGELKAIMRRLVSGGSSVREEAIYRGMAARKRMVER